MPPAGVSSSIRLGHTWYSVQDERLRAMLQSLLADRFELQVHPDTKPGTVYRLQRNGKTLRLKLLGDGDADTGNVGYAGGAWTLKSDMPQLAWFASSFILHAPVADDTGLQGTFYFRESSADADPQYTGAGNSASFIGFLAEAGLKLVRGNGLVETLTIEHAAKPTPN